MVASPESLRRRGPTITAYHHSSLVSVVGDAIAQSQLHVFLGQGCRAPGAASRIISGFQFSESCMTRHIHLFVQVLLQRTEDARVPALPGSSQDNTLLPDMMGKDTSKIVTSPPLFPRVTDRNCPSLLLLRPDADIPHERLCGSGDQNLHLERAQLLHTRRVVLIMSRDKPNIVLRE
jgi:hypothetical protein